MLMSQVQVPVPPPRFFKSAQNPVCLPQRGFVFFRLHLSLWTHTMNRWSLLSLQRATAAAALLALAWGLSPSLHAQPLPKRPFPAQALRAQMVVVNAHEVTLNGKLTRLSPGARIRTATNALVVSGGLVGQRFVVNYTRDSLGQAHEIWVLNAAEATDPRSGQEDMPRSNIVSGPPGSTAD
jgi:hypothetical protein